MRQVVLDTETTGLEVSQGHRVIEIGCVELENRRLTGNHFHQYVNPQRDIDQGAMEVHGITNEFVQNKPTFDKIARELIDFIRDAELIIHNAPFDVGFLNAELALTGHHDGGITNLCSVVDTLVMARTKHPGQRNNLDALCQRYDVDNSQRDLHGALLDAEILADVYLAMTGGQTALQLSETDDEPGTTGQGARPLRRLSQERQPLRIIRASEEEQRAHEAQLDVIAKSSGGKVLWRDILSEQ